MNQGPNAITATAAAGVAIAVTVLMAPHPVVARSLTLSQTQVMSPLTISSNISQAIFQYILKLQLICSSEASVEFF